MKNFEFNMGTEILFGKDQIDMLPNYLKQYGEKILMVYGGGSIKKIGLYDRAIDVLKNFSVLECSGIEPNPKLGKVYEGAKICEALMKTVIKYAPIAMREPDNYEARAQIMWAGSLGDNGFIALGNLAPAYSCHAIEHEVSAYYDITHGVGLAIITPHWMRYVLSEKTVDRFVQYGVAVWDIDERLPKMVIAETAIERTREFFASFGVPMTLSELGIDQCHFDAMAEHAVVVGKLQNGFVPLTSEDVKNILLMCK